MALVANVVEDLSDEETQLLNDDKANLEPIVPHPGKPEPVEGDDDPAATPEKTDQKADADKTAKPEGMVPQQALHEERERRKAERKAREEAERKFATLEGRLSVLQQLAQQAGQQQPKQEAATAAPQPIQIPDVNADPVGHFKALNEINNQKAAALERQLQEVSAWRQSQDQQAQQAATIQRAASIADAHEKEFAQREPNYYDAANYLRSMRDQELQAMGYANPTQRQQIIATDVYHIAQQALQNNQNFGEVAFAIAKSRGWTPKPAQEATPAPTTPAPVTPAAVNDQKKIEMVANGQRAGASLGQANGAAAPSTSLEALLNMSDDDFAAATKGDKWKNLLETAPRR